MTIILSIPILGLISILQSAVVSRLPLSHGTADFMLVVLVAVMLQKSFDATWQWSVVGGIFTDFLSGLPFGVFTISYILVTWFTLFFRERIWRFSFLMQLLVVLIGTLISHGITLLVLFFQGSTLEINTILQVVTLPSLILNFMLSLPVFIVIQDIFEQISLQE
jgi:rod shape-determining protein MreD